MKKNTSPNPSSRGQSLLEFAISLTFMLILLSGAVSFGIGLFHYIAMRDAAQEGALFGAINPDNAAGIQTRVRNASGGDSFLARLYDSGELTVNVTFPDGTACEGNRITVLLSYDYPLPMAFIGTFIGSNVIQLRATVTDTILTPSTSCP